MAYARIIEADVPFSGGRKFTFGSYDNFRGRGQSGTPDPIVTADDDDYPRSWVAIGSGSSWVVAGPTSGARPSSSGSGQVLCLQTGLTDGRSKATVNIPVNRSSFGTGLVVRCASINNFVFLNWRNDDDETTPGTGGGGYAISKMVSGSAQTVYGTGILPQTNDVISLTAIGDQFTFTLNGTDITTQTITDLSLQSGTYFGIRGPNPASMYFKDYEYMPADDL